jgi:prephenate dehydratase
MAQKPAHTRAAPLPKGARVIAFQGMHGAYSDLSCRTVYPGLETLPCASFEDAFGAVSSGTAQLAMIPIENSLAGRVADIHHLLPEGGLHIIGEHFQRINHCLMALPGTKPSDIKEVGSHVQALSQCRRYLRSRGLRPLIQADTAGSAALLAEERQADKAVIASSLAAEIYGLEILATDIEDADHNTTRFVILSPQSVIAPAGSGKVLTSLIFRVRNIPAALFKALGGFATNGVNLLKLESYLLEGSFQAAQFYLDVEGHPEERGLKLALEELDFFAREVKILGVYPANSYRDRDGG